MCCEEIADNSMAHLHLLQKFRTHESYILINKKKINKTEQNCIWHYIYFLIIFSKYRVNCSGRGILFGKGKVLCTAEFIGEQLNIKSMTNDTLIFDAMYSA